MDSRTSTVAISGKTVRYKIIDSDGDTGKDFIRKGTEQNGISQ